jgi:hypothetical protein
MGEVVPFPLARRRKYVQQQVRFLRTLSMAGAECVLTRQIANQGRAMLKRGFSPAVVKAQISALEEAIRAELVRSCRDGAA